MSETRRSQRAERFARGFTLIEVVVAIALLAIVVGPICGRLLALTARAVALSSQPPADIGAPETVDDAWKWSAIEIDDAKWEETKLNIEVRAAPGSDPIEIAWWIDGWYTGSAEDEGNGSFSVDPPEGGWPSEAHWLTLRARRGSEPWGTPWLTTLPTVATAADGTPVPSSAGLLTDQQLGAASAVVVLHYPGAAAPDVRLGSDNAPALELSPEGATALLLSPGSLDLYCDGALQSLTLEDGDVVHLYF